MLVPVNRSLRSSTQRGVQPWTLAPMRARPLEVIFGRTCGRRRNGRSNRKAFHVDARASSGDLLRTLRSATSPNKKQKSATPTINIADSGQFAGSAQGASTRMEGGPLPRRQRPGLVPLPRGETRVVVTLTVGAMPSGLRPGPTVSKSKKPNRNKGDKGNQPESPPPRTANKVGQHVEQNNTPVVRTPTTDLQESTHHGPLQAVPGDEEPVRPRMPRGRQPQRIMPRPGRPPKQRQSTQPPPLPD